VTRQIRPQQQAIIDHIVAHRSCAVWASMGAGKTGATYLALTALNLVEEVFPALVIAPLRVAQSTWPEEISSWGNRLAGLRVSVITGKPAERVLALNTPADVYTTNYDNVVWLIEQLGDKPWPFKTIVFDEATALRGLRVAWKESPLGKIYLAGQGTIRSRALATVVFNSRCRIIELTGTPAPNGLKTLWGQLWFIDFGQRLGRTYDAFSKRWFTNNQTYNGYPDLQPMPHAQGEIQTLVKDVCVSIDPRDYYSVQEAQTIPLWVDLPPAAMKLYKDMEKKLFVEIKGHEIEAFNAASRTNKCSQIANGAMYTGEDDGSDSREWVHVHDAKLNRLEELVEETAGMPIMVVYWFKSDLARLKKHFPQGKQLDKHAKTITDWNAGKIPLLFVHYRSGGHGLNLQHGSNICAIFGMTWDLELYMQVVERIGPIRQQQSGYDRVVFIYQILARKTIDEEMLARQRDKRDVQDLLLEAAKNRG
jgi:SNF2 family DNA or RNA helicase